MQRLSFALLGLAAGLAPLAADAETLRVGKGGGPQVFAFAPVDVGMAEGIFQRHGIEASIFSFDSAAKIHQAIAAGDLDIALASGADMAFIVKGSPAKTVAAMAGRPATMALVTEKDGPIRSPADLKGKTVSSTSAGSLTNWLAHEVAVKEGWGPDGINVVALGGETSQVAALKTHQTDAMVMDIVVAYRFEEAGEMRILVKFGDIVPSFAMHVIHATNAILASDPDGVRRFLAGWFETIEFMRTHRTETVKRVAAVINQPEHIVDRVYDDIMPIFSKDGCFDAKALDVLRHSYVEMGVLPSEPDMSALYTEQYLPQPCR